MAAVLNKKTALVLLLFLLLYSQYGCISSESLFIRNTSELHTTNLIPRITKKIFSNRENAVQSLTEAPEIQSLLLGYTKLDAPEAMIVLQTARTILGAELVYVMDRDGTVIACTPYDDGQTLTGNNYAFRPYFKKGMQGDNVIYPALGVTTHERGIYFSAPIHQSGDTNPRGVVVVKILVDDIDEILSQHQQPIFLLTPEGVVFSSNRKAHLYQYDSSLSAEAVNRLLASKQFSDAALSPFPLQIDTQTVEFENETYQMFSETFLTGWTLLILQKDTNSLEVNRTVLLAILWGMAALLFIVILLVKHNITIRKAENALRRSRALYESLFTLAPDGIIITSMDGSIRTFNASFQKFAKLSSEEIRQKDIRAFYVEPSRDRSELIAALKENNVIENYPLTLKNGVGEHRKVFISATLIDYQGETCIESVLRDITELENKDEQLRQAQKMELIGTLAGGLAHDINNMLGGITGGLSLLRIESKSGQDICPDRIAQHINIMERASQSIAMMAHQLLTLARKGESTAVPVDLNLSLKHVVKICTNSFDKCIDIRPEYAPAPAWVLLDPVQIEQVLLNLLINSSHAMTIMLPPGRPTGGTLSISLSKMSDLHEPLGHGHKVIHKDYWKLSITDQGVGMDDETKKRIFEPFFTTKASGKGTGLGLLMVQNIVHRYDGIIDVESEIDVGSTFNIYLPVVEHNLPSAHNEVDKRIRTGSGKILVVDDEEVMRLTVTELLIKFGYSVLTAQDGVEAISLFTNHHYRLDAVLLDVKMPKLSGLETFVELKKINKDVPVLIMSGYREDEEINELLDKGVDGFIRKPFSSDDLMNALEAALSGKAI